VDWTVTEFGKRIGIIRERKAELTQAEVNLHSTENRVRMDVESETRKVRRSQSGLEAARKSVAVRAELERILEDQVKMSTATEATLRDAQAQLAEAKAQLFEAEMQHVISQEELLNSLGRY
jgi:outer membrane protein TolC